jgi:DNA-binding NtrC family response regulator
VVERAVVLARGAEIELRDLPDDLNTCADQLGGAGAIGEARCCNLSAAVKDFEKQCIIKALADAEGNKSLAAKLLGISRKTLWEKCKTLDVAST